MSKLTLLPVCNTVFSLPVKTNSGKDWAIARYNRAVIPADSCEEQPCINIHTHHQTGYRLILNLNLSSMCVCIFWWVLPTLHIGWFRLWLTRYKRLLQSKSQRGSFFSTSVVFIWQSGWLVDASSFVLSPRVTSTLTWLQLMAVAGKGSQRTCQHYI